MEKKNPCEVCGGSGMIPAGAWTTESDASDCRQCGGTGIEPSAMWIFLIVLLASLLLLMVFVWLVLPPGTYLPRIPNGGYWPCLWGIC